MGLTNRERVLTALRHKEPDRVPIDFGGTRVSSIMAVTHAKLRKHMGLDHGRIRVDGPAQIVIEMEEDIRAAFDIDVRFVAHEPRQWREGHLVDGTPAELPAKFLPQPLEDGSEIIKDADGNAYMMKPAGGHWFDTVYPPLGNATHINEIDDKIEIIENFDTPYYHDMPYEDLAKF